MRRVAAALAVALALGAGLAPGSSAATFQYGVERSGAVRADLGRFASVVGEALSDERGWSLGGAVAYRRVRSGPDLRLVLASPARVARAAPGCSPRWSCTVGDRVLINDRRFRRGTASWTRSLGEYRQYVVSHEVGHWLGLEHRDCPGRGLPAPVMQQQSISLSGCRANVWPLPEERARVAELRGVGRGEGPFVGAGSSAPAASGDFDGDGHADPAVGVPGEGVGERSSAGAVNVLHGSPDGLTADRAAIVRQGRGLVGRPEGLDRLGHSLAAGDLDGDRIADLAVGVPDEDLAGGERAGAVVAIQSVRALFVHQGSAGVPGAQESTDGNG